MKKDKTVIALTALALLGLGSFWMLQSVSETIQTSEVILFGRVDDTDSEEQDVETMNEDESDKDEVTVIFEKLVKEHPTPWTQVIVEEE